MTKVKTDQDLHGRSRRQFLIGSLCAGTAVVAGAGLLSRWPHGPHNSTVVFRNPAYQLRQDSDGALLVCQTGSGESITFRVDEPAALFWNQVPTAEAYSSDGKSVTVDEIIEAIAPGFKDQAQTEWQRDARQFAQEALRQGVLLTTGAKVRIAYIPPQNRK